MHHQDFSGDPAGTGSKKMPHQAAAFHHRRGSAGAPAPSPASSVDDNNQPQAGSSSPMLHHQTQSQATGAQVKKKSGFQITSVTSAQISANNSLADDTESYDDMDESHTEDLSSSEMLDVSAVSRATDTGVPERSSSDETLNSLHGVDTPGLVSPNEPLHPHPIPPGPQQQASMVNGTVHHHPALQHSHSHHHHHSDSMGGAQLPLSATGGPPAGAPLATSGPAPVSTAVPGPSQSQRPPVLDNIIPAAGAAIQPVFAAVGGAAAETLLSGYVNALNASAVNASGGGGQGVYAGIGPGPVAQGPAATPSAAHPQQTQTQAATGSRFRVVKLDTNSEPFRKGRWMCTEYYEKEIPQTAASETARAAAEAAAETEAASPGPAALQPPQTLQPYPQPGQDFTSPQPMQAGVLPGQVLPGQEGVLGGGGHILQQPPSVPQVMAQGAGGQPPSAMPQPLPVLYAADSHQAQAQAGYAPPQLPGGMMGQGAVRQPDFIQPTAPFQTQVPPQPHITSSVSMTMGLGGGAQPAGALAPQLLLQRQAPAAHANFAPAAQPQQQLYPSQPQAPSTATMPAQVAPTHHVGYPYLPLTSLQADLQPLLAPGATFMQTSGVMGGHHGGLPHHVDMGSLRSAQLDDPQRLLFQHQSLLGMPRGERTVTQAIGAAGALTQMGMAAEASALVAAAAAGLRTHTVEGDDSSSGTSVVAIDNKIEQAMDLVKSHLMYAVREEVEVLKEQIKELIERNSQLEQENNLLKTLASPEQMAQFQAQVQTGGSPTAGTNANAIAAVNPAQPPPAANAPSLVAPSSAQNTGTSA